MLTVEADRRNTTSLDLTFHSNKDPSLTERLPLSIQFVRTYPFPIELYKKFNSKFIKKRGLIAVNLDKFCQS